LGLEDLKEAVGERWRIEHGLEEQEAAARVLVMSECEESLAEAGVAAEALSASDEPEIEFVLGGAKVGEEFGVIALGVIDEVAGVNLEKPGEEETGRVGEVRAGAALDLREIGLAKGGFAVGCFGVGLDGADQLLLGHGAVEATKAALDLAEIADFVAEFHGYCRSQYLYRNLRYTSRGFRRDAFGMRTRPIAASGLGNRELQAVEVGLA
jgi:hypothetical protein